MITIINMGHPLSKAAIEVIENQYAAGKGLRIIHVAVQFDLKKPLMPQVQKSLSKGIKQAGGNPYDIDIVIPPGLNYAAYLVPLAFLTITEQKRPYLPNMLVIDKVGLPPKFLPVQLVRYTW